MALVLAAQPQLVGAQGTWTSTSAPFNASSPLLLTDGSVMVHEYATARW